MRGTETHSIGHEQNDPYPDRVYRIFLPVRGEPDFYVWQRQHTEEMQSAVREMPSWKKLLEMPPESRYFRTVWRYFMRDNYLTHDGSR